MALGTSTWILESGWQSTLKKTKYRPIEQAREPRDKPTHTWVPYFWQRKQENTMGQR